MERENCVEEWRGEIEQKDGKGKLCRRMERKNCVEEGKGENCVGDGRGEIVQKNGEGKLCRRIERGNYVDEWRGEIVQKDGEGKLCRRMTMVVLVKSCILNTSPGYNRISGYSRVQTSPQLEFIHGYKPGPGPGVCAGPCEGTGKGDLFRVWNKYLNLDIIYSNSIPHCICIHIGNIPYNDVVSDIQDKGLNLPKDRVKGLNLPKDRVVVRDIQDEGLNLPKDRVVVREIQDKRLNLPKDTVVVREIQDKGLILPKDRDLVKISRIKD